MLLGLMKVVMIGLKTIAPNPKPATTLPATTPLYVGNHWNATGVKFTFTKKLCFEVFVKTSSTQVQEWEILQF